MSEYLPSFIVEPVLRQARRFSERLGGDESPATATTAGSSFTLPAVPDLQRFYPSRFWNQSPLPVTEGTSEGIASTSVHNDSVPEESTLRSIARNIQLWASQISNLDMDDDVIQEPVLPSIEESDHALVSGSTTLTEEPANIVSDIGVARFLPAESIPQPSSRSLPITNQLRQPQRTSSETSINPAHELSYQSQIREHNTQGRSHSDPFATLNVTSAGNFSTRDSSRETYGESAYPRISDGSGMLPEDDGMKPLRRKINAVWSGPGTAQEKSQLVHMLMMERYRASQRTITPTSSAVTATSPLFRAHSPLSLPSIRSEESVFNLSQSDLQPTYAPLGADDVPDEITGEIPKPDLGCIHYKRNVKMQCVACEKWYPCRICHDEKEDHQLPRRETKHMLCMICSTPQSVSQVCKMCHVQAAYYYCAICKLWNNDANKSIYHCDDCGICRLGQGLGKDFFHCKTCAACMSISAESTHKCIERSTKCDCPICGEFLFTSSSTVNFMRCGHAIHETCFTEWCNTSYKCPICSRSIANMESQFRRLDRHIEDQPMPTEYSNNRAYVFCNDCNSRSVVRYHWLGLKCAVCDSYNTVQLELLGAENPVIQERAERAVEMGVGEAGITASQSHTPTEDLTTPASRPDTGQTTPATTNSMRRQGSSAGTSTPASVVAAPGRRDSPFHAVPHSPSRSARAMSPVVGSYFGTGQRPLPTENRRGSYFSVLSFGTTMEDGPSQPSGQKEPSSSTARPASHLSQSHLSPPLTSSHQNLHSLRRGNTPLEDDDNMDFWGGHSPRNHDDDIVDLDLEADDGEDESSSDEDEEMVDDDDDGDEEEDPMDILIGHR